MADQDKQWQLLQVNPDERELLDSQVAIIEMQREAIRDAIREKGAPLTDEERGNIQQRYSPNYENTELDYIKDLMSFTDKNSGITRRYETVPGLAEGGSPDQEFVNDRIAELMAEEPVNEMRASSPDVFQRQEQAIESFLGGIGQFADEKNIRFLKQMANPQYTRDVAETMSFGADMTPVLGDIQAIREGSRMMGDDQPLMGGALMAASVFSSVPPNKLKVVLAKIKNQLKNDVPESIYDAENFMRGPNKGDLRQGQNMLYKAEAEKNRLLDLEKQLEDALANPEAPFDDVRINEALMQVKTPRDLEALKPVLNNLRNRRIPKQMREENLKGIVNANAKTRKLYQEIIDSPSRINTKNHQKVAKETSEQFREIQKGVDNADLEDRNEIIRFLAQLKDKKPK